MLYPFVDIPEEMEGQETQPYREYGLDFETGQVTGKIVEGLEAVKVWVWLALQTPRYRYYVYSWNYGQEYEDLIGKGYSRDYILSELERMTEECLMVNPYVTGIKDFSAEFEEEKVTVMFTILTDFGDEEVSVDV